MLGPNWGPLLTDILHYIKIGIQRGFQALVVTPAQMYRHFKKFIESVGGLL